MTKASQQLDAAVRRAYDDQRHAADRIFVDREIRDDFLSRVVSLYPEAGETESLEHLERLRKRGSQNGGLPRKSR